MRTKSKTLGANGRAFKLAEGISTGGVKRGEQEIVQVRMNPLYPRGEVRVTATSEIRLYFLDVDADER